MTDMQRYARLDGGIVAEIIDIPSGIALADAVPPIFAAVLIKCSADVQQGWLRDGKRFVAPPPQRRTADAALSDLAALRTAAEVGGCDVLLPGMATPVRVATGRDICADIERAERRVRNGNWPEAGREVKIADGAFVLLTAAGVTALAQAVDAHIDACAAHEARLAKRIKADPSVDITTGWPGQTPA